LALRFEIEELRRRQPGSIETLRRELRIELDQAVRMGIGQRSQNHRVHDAENGGVRPDAERQSEDGDEACGGRSDHQPQREPEIVPKSSYGKGHAVHIPAGQS
jgi:hypothetical protein